MRSTVARDGALADFDAQARREVGEYFHLESIVRRGPQSLVYRAFGPGGREPVALKVVPREGIEHRFTRTATVAETLEHAHIVPVLEHGETPHFFWYAMPLIEGRSLDRVLMEDGPLELKSCLRMVEQVASALQYAHRRSLVHGNVKPENVLVNAEGWTLVSDFCMPGALERAGNRMVPARLPAYAAPELLENAPLPPSDQYSLAVLVHECLTGTVPASPGTPDEPAAPNPRVAMPRVPGSARLAVPDRVLPALRRAMAPSPSERFPTILAFVAALDMAPAQTRVTGFAAATPNRKSQPTVLTMEPESRAGRFFFWLLVILVMGGATAFGVQRFLKTERARQLAERLDRWYEADAPPGGIVLAPPAPPRPQPAPAPAPETTMARPPASTQPTARADTPGTQPPARANTPAIRRAPAPRATPPRPVVVDPEPVVAQPGHLTVSSMPWGTVYLDGRPIGNTPLRNVEIPAGPHTIRITRDGFVPFERGIDVAPGDSVRLVGISLREGGR